MGKISINMRLCVLLAIWAAAISGCQKNYHVEAQLPPVSCLDVEAAGTDILTNSDAIRLLNSEFTPNGRQSECWRTVMDVSLSKNYELPPPLLKQALKVYNTDQEKDRFGKTAMMYFMRIAQGKKHYAATDKGFLKAYSSHLINQAESQEDKQLSNIRLLCRRIDPDLYNKIFK